MNALTITPAMIRRFPFAVNPSRITVEDEMAIGKDMIKRRKAERKDASQGEMSRSSILAQEYAKLGGKKFQARKAEERRKAIIDILSSGEKLLKDILTELEARGHHIISYKAMGNYVDAMRRQGVVVARREKFGGGFTNIWRLAEGVTE